MDGKTLRQAMLASLSQERYDALAPAFTVALTRANCTTVNRAAMFCAQIGHESAGLRYMEEIASGAAYEGRRDLGNTRKGDGKRFKGRGPIQITGRANYTALSKWAHGKGYVPSATYFVDNPTELATVEYGFLGAVWYWTVARPTLNAKSDAGDVTAVTRLINGGTNGLADRKKRWTTCKGIGSALLPSTKSSTASPASSVRVLKVGMRGADVDALKDGLRTVLRGYAAGLANDNYFSANTGGVIREFQKRSNLTVDGVVGPATRAALNKIGVKF